TDKRNLFGKKKSTIRTSLSTDISNLSFEMHRRTTKLSIKQQHEMIPLHCNCKQESILNDNRIIQKPGHYVNNRKLTTMLIFISFSFLLLTLPIIIINIYI
ncbi:unnamed protein product, partial [Didymodactylos carnosus]